MLNVQRSIWTKGMPLLRFQLNVWGSCVMQWIKILMIGSQCKNWGITFRLSSYHLRIIYQTWCFRKLSQVEDTLMKLKGWLLFLMKKLQQLSVDVINGTHKQSNGRSHIVNLETTGLFFSLQWTSESLPCQSQGLSQPKLQLSSNRKKNIRLQYNLGKELPLDNQWDFLKF